MLLTLPASKSISNRALILAALSDKPVVLKNLLESDDTRYLRGVLENLGVRIMGQGVGEYLIIPPEHLCGNDSDNFIGNAGTAARFSVGLSLITEGSFTLRGVDRMHQRPFADLFEAIEEGIRITYLGEAGFLPVKLSNNRDQRSDISKITISGAISSQFITALLLVGARLPKGLEIEILDSVPSQPYIDMTLQMLSIWGIKYSLWSSSDSIRGSSDLTLDSRVKPENDNTIIKIHPGVTAPASYTIPPDMSAASIPIAFGKMMEWDFDLDYEKGKTLQGDEAFGSVIEPLQNLRTEGLENLRTLDFEACPDVSMTGMVLAAVSPGTTKFIGLESLRVKECDRIEAMREGLHQLGFEVSVQGDEVTIVGNPEAQFPPDKGERSRSDQGGLKINAYDDHRIAFCFAILLYRLGIKDVRDIRKMISNPECVSKTWPDFWLDLGSWTDQLRAVSGVIVKKEDTYLLVKKPRKDHAWQLPQGGRDPGETGLKAARRELSEECGEDLQVKWVGERAVGSYRYFFPDDFKRHDENITGAEVSFYLGAYIAGEVQLDKNEIVDFKWATKDEIKNLVDKVYWDAIKSMFD
ncbi:MAG TPA: NUDIX domain-containing protein [Candidatus Gracilibacteria bacterium]